MKKTLSAAAVALLALTACGGVEQDATYDSSTDFAEALNAINEDYRCRGMDDDAKVLERDGWAMVSCWNMAGGIFTSDESRQWVYSRNPLERGEIWLEGPNWSIHGDQYQIETVHEHLGGTILDD